MSDDNHAILLTPPGAAAIAVVRLQGPRVRDFLAAHFSVASPKPMCCTHGKLTDADQTIDDPIVVLSEDGQSVDLNLHGGTWVVSSVLALAAREGFDLTFDRSPEQNVSDTIEQEVLDALPLATTELALRVLLNQPTAWAKLLNQTTAPAGPIASSRNKPARQEPRPPIIVDDLLTDRALHWLLHPPRVAIVGAPNVGKSTLANQLFARERSITADLPGTTRDWIGEIANLDGLAAMLVDTPGLRETADAIEREAIARSRGQIEKADLVLHVLDVTQPPEALEFESDAEVIRVANKCDLPNQWEPSESALKVCAKTGQGVSQLIERIKQFFGCSNIDVTQPRCWTDRQRTMLAQKWHGSSNRAIDCI